MKGLGPCGTGGSKNISRFEGQENCLNSVFVAKIIKKNNSLVTVLERWNCKVPRSILDFTAKKTIKNLDI